MAIAGSVVTFSLLIDRAGLIPAVMATVVVASLAGGQQRLRRTLILSVCLATAVWLLFVGLLDQPFSAIRSF
jgi:branched-subunit amino acid transport protein AzlD